MALDYSNFGAVSDSGVGQYNQLANLAQLQSGQSWDIGNKAAGYADPFMDQRDQYQKQLKDLMTNPGSIESSPYLKYLMETQMNQVNASNAAGGFRNSGRGLMALQDRAAGVASQAYPEQAKLLAALAGATTGSPAAAGLAFSEGATRGQNQEQMAAAARSLSQQPKSQAYDPYAWMTNLYQNQGSSLPSGGGYVPGSGSTPYGGWDAGSQIAANNAQLSLLDLANQYDSSPSYSTSYDDYYGDYSGGNTTSSGSFGNNFGYDDPYSSYIDPYSYDQNYG